VNLASLEGVHFILEVVEFERLDMREALGELLVQDLVEEEGLMFRV
jgi:hypothetical protein